MMGVWDMGRLTVSYVRGRYIPGARNISIEIDGIPRGNIGNRESRTFGLPDGRHLVVFRYSFVTTKVDLFLTGEDSFTVSWDRAGGGMRIAREFEREVYIDRRSAGYLAAYAAAVLIAFITGGLAMNRTIPFAYYAAIILIIMIFMIFLLVRLIRGMSRTFVWG